jgi:hypothetical protein
MLNVKLNEKQLEFTFNLLDLYLKSNGLKGLVESVDLFNALQQAEKIDEKAKPEEPGEDVPF